MRRWNVKRKGRKLWKRNKGREKQEEREIQERKRMYVKKIK